MRQDSTTFDNVFKTFYENVFFDAIDKNNITHVIHLGDVVERRKFINFVTCKGLHDYFMKPLYDRGIHLDVIIGNHDCFYKNHNNVNSMLELYGNHSRYMDNIDIIYDEPKVKTYDGLNIGLVPWIADENAQSCYDFMIHADTDILMGHFEIEGFQMHKGVHNHDGIKPHVFTRFERVFSGHFHHKQRKRNIDYLGSPYQTSWADYDDPKGFHIFDTDTKELEFVKNPIDMFYKVWYDDRNSVSLDDYSQFEGKYVKVIVQHKDNPFQYDLFIKQLEEANCADISVVEDHYNMQDIKGEELLDEAADTLEIVQTYVENIETSPEFRNKIMRKFGHLYREVLSG